MTDDSRPISLKVQAEGGTATSAEAISIGLIVAELVINAFRHAFAGRRLVSFWRGASPQRSLSGAYRAGWFRDRRKQSRVQRAPPPAWSCARRALAPDCRRERSRPARSGLLSALAQYAAHKALLRVWVEAGVGAADGTKRRLDASPLGPFTVTSRRNYYLELITIPSPRKRPFRERRQSNDPADAENRKQV